MHRAGRLAALLASCFALLALAYSTWLPLWEAPDEVAHFEYITDLLTGGYSLPRQQLDHLSEAHQPPLYYALAAPLVGLADLKDPSGRVQLNPMFPWAGRGGTDKNIALHGSRETFPYRGWALALRLARLLSVALGTASVGFTIAIARLAFPKHPWAAVAAGGFMAFCPQFLFMSGVVNNDNLLILAATVSVWQTLRILRRPTQTRLWAGLGVWLGIAILAKPHGAAVLGTCGIALLWHLRATLGWRPFARRALVSALPIAGITLWWFVRNQVVYGDPLGVGVYESIYWMNLRTAPLDLDAIWAMVTVQFQTFWAAFGWMTVIAPTCYYLLVGLLQVGALVGVVRAWRRGAFRTLPARRRQVLGVLALACVVQYAFVFCTITRCNESCYQGRYLFPALSGLSVWLTVGLAGPDAKGSRRAVAAAALLLVAALYLGAGVLRPAFVTVPLPRGASGCSQPCRYGLREDVRLRGYEIEPDSSGRMTVTPLGGAPHAGLRLPVFTHVLDQEGERVAQADQLPGLDQDYPPTKWLVGDIVRDRHVMDLAALDAGEECVLWIGLYDWSNGERLAAEASPGQTVQENALVIPLR